MKIISLALASAGLIALSACGGGATKNQSNDAANSSATTTTDFNTSSTAPPLDPASTPGGTTLDANSTSTSKGSTGTTGADASGNLSGTNSVADNTAGNTTTR